MGAFVLERCPRDRQSFCSQDSASSRDADAEGAGSGFWRVVGAADAIEEKAAAMQQQFLRGIGFARALMAG